MDALDDSHEDHGEGSVCRLRIRLRMLQFQAFVNYAPHKHFAEPGNDEVVTADNAAENMLLSGENREEMYREQQVLTFES